MKNKIKKLKLPLSKMTGDEKDYAAVLLEDVNSNMKAFWEVLQGVKEKSDATFEQTGRMTERLDSMEDKLETTNKRLDSMEIKLDDLINAVSLIKKEIEALKTSLSTKADKDKLATLEFKIVRIEKYLKIAQ